MTFTHLRSRLAAAMLASLALLSALPAAATTPASDVTYMGRTLADRLADAVNVKDYGALGDGSTDDCTAFQNALATGRTIFVPKSSGAYKIACQLTMTASDQNVICDGRGTELKLYYSAGPQIVVGGASALTADVGFQSCRLTSAQAGQAMFFTRYVRGFRLVDVTATADQLLRLGDSSLDTAHPTYVVELYGGDELHRVDSPTMHYVNAENFAGQWVADHAFYEGPFLSGLSGFRCTDNIQSHIDDMQWVQGYWSRDDVNLDFTDCRVTNVKLTDLQSEGALTNAVKIAVTAAVDTSNKTRVGAEGVIITGGRYDAGDHVTPVSGGGAAILLSHDSNVSGVEAIRQISITGAQITGGAALATTPIVVESLQANSSVSLIQIRGINGEFKASNTSQDFLRLTGNATSGALRDVTVDGINAWSTSAVMRSGIRVEGTGDLNIAIGPENTVRNGAFLYSDTSGVVAIPRQKLGASTTLYVRTDGSDSNNGLANTSSGAFLTPTAAWNYAVSTYDLNGKTLFLQVGDGTYAPSSGTRVLDAATSPVGGGSIVLTGNATTPSNVLFSSTSADAIRVAADLGQTTFRVQNLKMTAATSGSDLNVQAPGAVQVAGVDFGAAAADQMLVQAQGATLTATGNYTISGGAVAHAQVQQQGQIQLTGRTVTLTGTPAFSFFVAVQRFALARVEAMSFTGSATGNRYAATENGVIYTNAAGATYLPGNAAGSVSTGGVYN